jgi:oxygen-independent coproporphyrinogen-3 oxidase
MGQKELLIDALVKEINMDQRPKGQGNAAAEKLSTLYIGGGTPSILSIDQLKLIIEALQKQFVFDKDIETTLEANPDDITGAKLQEWKQAGINRLSVGIQSFKDEELKWMNRIHSAKESLICLDDIRNAGFTNYSIDLIYGSPLQSDDDWKRNVEIMIEKNIPHISCYALTVEPKTALEKMIALHKRPPTDPEKQARHFLLLMDWMQQAGYEHYEISNFAKPGMRSRHNSSYWQGKHYRGYGPSAHSFDGNSRRWNVANNSVYIQSLEKDIIPFEEEILTPVQQLNEYIMTSLRTIEGIDLDHVREKFGEKFSNTLSAAAKKFMAYNHLVAINSSLLLTREGKLFADGISADLFF